MIFFASIRSHETMYRRRTQRYLFMTYAALLIISRFTFKLFDDSRWVSRYPKVTGALLAGTIILIVWGAGLDVMVQEASFQRNFKYPLILQQEDFQKVVNDYRIGSPSILPQYTSYSSVQIVSSQRCENSVPYDFLILVKSAPQNSAHRDAIRSTWKEEHYSGISVKVMFFMGKKEMHEDFTDNLDDIVHLDFIENYYNNTYKTVAEMRWAIERCSNFHYALLIDDDYFLNVRNLKRFVEEREHQKMSERLYAGQVFFVRPLRHRLFNKWFISYDEYAYDRFPPFINAGNILLSKRALEDIYYSTFFVKPFRFDDVYIGICAFKMGISPTHSDQMLFDVQEGDVLRPELIAGHGYGPERLKRFWVVQRNAEIV